VFHLVTVTTWLFVAIPGLTGVTGTELARIVVFWVAAVVLVTLARWIARTLARRDTAYVQRAVVVGTDDVGQLIARKLLHHPEYRIELAGFIGSPPSDSGPDLEHVPLLGPLEDAAELVTAHAVERVIVAFPDAPTAELLSLVHSLRQLDVQIDVVPRLFEVVGPNVDVHGVEGIHLLGLPPARPSRSSRVLKRSLDVVVASVLLALTAPLFAYIAFRVKRDSPGPVFFRQRRVGLGMHEFTVLKFRTMQVGTSEAEHRKYVATLMDRNAAPTSNGLYKPDRADVVTPFGRWLRRTSLDELPQLVNVLRGDMSLVGPRPCIPYELEHLAPHHFDRFLVPAGMTGLWQVKARAHATIAEALDLDVAYAHGWSFGLDLRLLCQTPLEVLRPRHTA
jgi:exopolysaccharide biosynthesis polyprenyl glycosylphosphotransferase